MLKRRGERPLGKPKYVFDATPLIYLAKVGLLEIALDLCEAYTTRFVEVETTTNFSYPDAIKIKDCIKKGGLQIYQPTVENVKVLSRHSEIHRGEAEVLAAARELEAFAIIDDKEARSVAKIYEIQTHPGTLFILFELVAK